MNAPWKCRPSQRLALALALNAVLASTVWAQGFDRIRRRSGIDSGKITEVSALAVTISKGGVESKVPVEEIRSIDFAGEPEELRSIRSAIKGGRFDDALGRLKEISRTGIDRDEILQDLDYLQVECQANLALAGQGDLKTAAQQVSDFLKQHRRSYRLTQAIELLGTLYVAAGNHSGARSQFTKLGKAPSPYFKSRSAMLLGRSLQEEGQHDQAVAEFDKALAAAQGNAAAKNLELEATLHRAVSESAIGNVKQSTAVVKEIISRADAEDSRLLAQAYNALGDCYLQSGNKKAARDAFLHVDLLFSSAAGEHAKALYELAQLWSALGQEARARDAGQRLQDEYPGSRWAKR